MIGISRRAEDGAWIVLEYRSGDLIELCGPFASREAAVDAAARYIERHCKTMSVLDEANDPLRDVTRRSGAASTRHEYTRQEEAKTRTVSTSDH